MERYVIIGNGVAAAACIEGIRSVDTEGSITVVSEEQHEVYCRPLISYYLEGKTDICRMKYRKDDFYIKANADVIYGKRAERIDTEGKNIVLDDGNEIPYTKLCIATGSSPFVPPFSGLESVKKKFSFMTLDDAILLEKEICSESRVLIVGAGLIGLKCAEGIKEKVKEITVCDLAPCILSSILDKESAETVKEHLEGEGIKFMLADSAESFEGNMAHMKSGKTVEFDILVLAVGVRANTKLMRDIGGEVNRGIIVDEGMHTGIKDIYSAGDCAEGNDISLGSKRVLALLPNAYQQGYCAGVNMAGGNKVFDNAIPMNSIGLFGLHIMTAGTYYTPEQGGEVYEERGEKTVKKLFVREGLLKGFILIGKNERAGIYTSMIRERVPIDSVDFELLKKIPTSVAFSQKKRRNMFGGVV